MTSLAGKTLFITGASRGIGLAIAVRAAKDGANIAIAAKSDQPNPRLPGTIHTAAEAIEAAGGKVTREAGPVKGGTTVIAFVTDPDGYKIELIERKNDSHTGTGLR